MTVVFVVDVGRLGREFGLEPRDPWLPRADDDRRARHNTRGSRGLRAAGSTRARRHSLDEPSAAYWR
jgi:hypothetical protein